MTKSTPRGWHLLCEASNRLEAIFIQGRLQAHGIPVHIVSEPAAELYGITHGALAVARVFVPEPLADEARRVLEEVPPPPEGNDAPPTDSAP